MKKFSTMLMALMMVLSASAIDLASLKKLPAPKNLKIERFNRPNSPVRKAAAAWENTPAPFASMYNSTGFAYDFDAPGEDPWYETDPWQTWAEEYVYEGDGKTYYGLVNIIPNEDMWVEDPVIDYYYNAEEGAVVVSATPLARYDEETLIYIMDIYDFGQGESGDIYFTLDKDGNFAREADCHSHAVAWAVCYYDEETYEPIDILGYFSVYSAMDYEKSVVVESAITYTANEKLPETWSTNYSGLHTNAFNVAITSHTFSDGIGTITFSGEVTSIGDHAFYNCSGLTSITIPNSVRSIGGYAFSGCSGLTSITIPNSVTSIGYDAFSRCTGLTSVTIPSSVTSIGGYAFSYCSGLTSITIPESVTSIGDYAFRGCSGLTSITIPNSVTSIGSYAFSGCSGLTSIVWNAKNYQSPTNSDRAPFNGISPQITDFTFGEEVESVPNYLCYGMSNLTSITIPNSVMSIGDYAFRSCSGLTSVTIPNSVTSIGDMAFCRCSGLTSIVVESGNTNYDSRDNCNAIIETSTNTLIAGCQNTVIPNSVTSIGNEAFRYCSGLTSVTIPNSVMSIGESAFRECSGLTSIVWNAKNYQSPTNSDRAPFNGISSQITDFTLGEEVESVPNYLCYGMNKLTSITIPNSVTSISGYAFSGCFGLTSITIPNSVTSIGESAFRECSGLTSIVWNAKNYQSPTNSDRAPFNGISSQITDFTFGEEVESVPNYLCYGMNKLTSITIPNSVTSIGESAFRGCSGLACITIPNSVMNIGGYAFSGCSGLTSIVWNAKNYQSPTNSDRAPFNGISSQITDFTLGEEVESVPNYLCYGMNKLTSITIPNSVTSIGESAFRGCSGLTSITIPNSVTSISGYAFSGCFGLTSITIPNSVTSIGTSAFSGCSGFTSITIPNSVTSIGDFAFYYCSGLTSITIPNSVTNIGKSAFSGCSGLTSIVWNAKNCSSPSGSSVAPFYEISSQITDFTLGEEVESVPNYLCSGMNNLTSITIPNSVTRIGDHAFAYCSGFTSITIPNSVTSIGSYAFEGCSGLTSITIPNSVTSIGGYAFQNCSGVTELTIGSLVSSIGDYAFYGCKRLVTITCFATNPPTAYGNSFQYYDCDLYVPCDELRTYKRDEVFGLFENIECIGAESGETVTDVVTTPSDNTVTILWPKDDAASTYTIVITKDGITICTLTFNAAGQLMNIAFAPGRDTEMPSHAAESINGSWSFTVTGLNSGTKYEYSVTTKNSAQSVLSSYSGSFTTTGLVPTSLDNTSIEVKATKFFRDGQLHIIRDEKIYTVEGSVVK